MTTRVLITNPDAHCAVEVFTVGYGSTLPTPVFGAGVTVPIGESREFWVYGGQSLFVREKPE